MTEHLFARYEAADSKLKELVGRARQITVCLDEWTKKGLSLSFLGVSACFYDPTDSVPRHIVMRIKQIEHPHTSERLKEVVMETLTEWNIDRSKVVMLVTDNGANVVKAMRLMREEASESDAIEGEQEEDAEEEEDFVNDEDQDDSELSEDYQEEFTVPFVSLRHMPCMAHTLQLVVKKALSTNSCSILSKARSLVGHVRKSGVAVQKLQDICGKTLPVDNATRWNSSYLMMKRLTELRHSINQVVQMLKVDTLRVAEWEEVENVVNLLEPFADQTNLLQSDAHSLSYIIPALLDLQYHLHNFEPLRMVSRAMLQDLNRRFEHILQPSSEHFNPLPAAACLLDPTVAAVMLTDDVKELLEASKCYVISQVCFWDYFSCCCFAYIIFHLFYTPTF